MKNLLLTLMLLVITTGTASASEIDTLWYRTMSAGARNVDFTPDDKYVIAWTNAIEFWEVQQGVIEFSVPTELLGDYNFNEEFLVFSQDSTPKLLKWQTREVVEGFKKESFRLDKIRTAKSKNEFMALGYLKEGISLYDSECTIYFWDINSKLLVDSLEISNQFEKDDYTWRRAVLDFDYIGNNDEFLYVKFDDYNNRVVPVPPSERRTNYFYHIYDRNTKELVDSLFLLQDITNGSVAPISNMFVMKDRSKIAWNNKGGMINFYNVYTRKFYDQLVFHYHDFAEASDIEFNLDESKVGITFGKDLKIYDLQSKELVYFSNISSKENISFSNNEELLVANVNSYLLLLPSHIVNTSVNETDNNNLNLIVTPNPASNTISIHFNSVTDELINLSIIDLVGNELDIIDVGIIENQNYSIDYDISNLTPATYFIRLDVGGEIFTKKFIKE